MSKKNILTEKLSIKDIIMIMKDCEKKIMAKVQ